MATLEDVLIGVASYINQDPALPTGTDLSMWINFANQSQNEWADSYIWRRQLTVEYKPSIEASQVSIGMPSNFDRLLSPVYHYDGDPPSEIYEIHPSEKYKKLSTDEYVYKVGNKTAGVALIINPPLASGASISMQYLSSPSAMATYASTLTCPSSQFIILRSISKILSSRSDPRFTIVKADSDLLLGHMMDDEAAPPGGQDNQTPVSFEKKGFRVGES
jgi:hypothetical protein